MSIINFYFVYFQRHANNPHLPVGQMGVMIA